jgi:hypothetical protein
MEHRLGLKVAKQKSLFFLCIGIRLVADLRDGTYRDEKDEKKESDKAAVGLQWPS